MGVPTRRILLLGALALGEQLCWRDIIPRRVELPIKLVLSGRCILFLRPAAQHYDGQDRTFGCRKLATLDRTEDRLQPNTGQHKNKSAISSSSSLRTQRSALSTRDVKQEPDLLPDRLPLSAVWSFSRRLRKQSAEHQRQVLVAANQ